MRLIDTERMRLRNVREMEGAAYLGFVLDLSFLAPAAAWIMAASQFGHRTYDDRICDDFTMTQ